MDCFLGLLSKSKLSYKRHFCFLEDRSAICVRSTEKTEGNYQLQDGKMVKCVLRMFPQGSILVWVKNTGYLKERFGTRKK